MDALVAWKFTDMMIRLYKYIAILNNDSIVTRSVPHLFSPLLLITLLLVCPPLLAETAILTTFSITGKISIQSWKALRDKRVVKQDLDYSCSAASLATLLNEFYAQNITEEMLLKAMDKGNARASFEDMQRVLPQFSFRAQGYAATFAQLRKLTMPVIVYLKHRKDDHFSVLRGISEDTVWLADPALGNRTYSQAQFLEMWQTRDAEQEYAHLQGKFLAVLPLQEKTVLNSAEFFTLMPQRQTTSAIQSLANRFLP